MTIPDLGHCAASGTPPVEGSIQDGARGSTGLCPACSGRFELLPTGLLSLHDAAETSDREQWPERRVSTDSLPP